MRTMCVVLAISIAAGLVAAQEGTGLRPEVRQERLAARDRLTSEYRRLGREGRFAEAIQVLKRALAIEEEVFGAAHEECVGTCWWLARYEELRGKFGRARAWLEQAVRIRAKLYGQEDWRTRDAHRWISDLEHRRSLGEDDRSELRRALDLESAAFDHADRGRSREAIAAAEQVLAIRTRILGKTHPDTALALGNLAWLHEAAGESTKAVALYREALSRQAEALGRDHPEHARLWNAFGLLCTSRGRYDDAEKALRRAFEIRLKVLGPDHPDSAQSRHNLATLYTRTGDIEQARTLFEQALSTWGETVGESHPDYAKALNGLATLHLHVGDYASAEPLFLRALGILRTRLGARHRDCAVILNALGVLYVRTGEFGQAEDVLRQAVGLFRETRGVHHPDYANGLRNLALLLLKKGEFVRAERRFREALEIDRRALGEDHPSFTTGLVNLAALYKTLGQLDEAEKLVRRALEIDRRVLGENHPMLAKTLNNLAALLHARGRSADAEALYREALRIRGATYGQESPVYAAMLNNLAVTCREGGRLEEAMRLGRRALEIEREVLGEDHPEVAISLNNLALTEIAAGRTEEAEEAYRTALGILGMALGEGHPAHATVQHNLAQHLAARGAHREAAATCRRALGARQRALDLAASMLSDRQQLRMARPFRNTLDLHLALGSLSGAPGADAYAPLLVWKGAVLARQMRERSRRRDPEHAGLLAAMDRTSRRLAALSLAVPGTRQREAWRRQIAALGEELEDRKRALKKSSAAFREARALESMTGARLSRSLPGGAALVDWIEYERLDRGRHLAAFVTASHAEVVRVDLGPVAPIRAAIEAWRGGIRRTGPHETARTLRSLLWEPILPHLGGAKTILVSPDGALHRLPFAALPGKKSGTYLIEEVAVAVVPVPRLLPRLLATKSTDDEPSLLLIGDVDHGGAPGRGEGGRPAAGTVTGVLPTFEKLDATRAEILAIRDSFETTHEDGEVKLLRRGKATEEAFRREAGRHRWLHVATHGFFAPPGLRSALVGTDRRWTGAGEEPLFGYHPGLLSGLALSGANTPPEDDGDDGILTALEVASLDLSKIDVAVLSACETGLGEVAGGEGVLGLQRAFQVAGARTTITSLWKVPDAATQLLMQRFYANLWERGLGKLAALREAQIWLMREGGRRGIRPLDGDGMEKPETLPPFYWAGFVLSGDWR